MRKDVSEKPMHEKLGMSCSRNSQKQGLLRGPSSERIPRDSAPQAPNCGKQARESSIQRDKGTEKGKDMIPNVYKVECSPDTVGIWF